MALIPFAHQEDLIGLCQKRKAKVYLVGGFLRSYYLQTPSSDVDFAVEKGALALAKGFSKKIRGAFVLLDDEHGSARVVKESDGKVWTFDFTDLRAKTIAGDLKLRDFTVNTFCIELLTGKDISPLKARQDFKAKTIRMVSARSLTDDPLRLLRAFSLFAQTGFKIEPKTRASIKAHAHLITKPAMERCREELFKILHTTRAYDAVLQMQTTGVLFRLMPHLEVMVGVNQGGYHHLDVWNHSLLALKELEGVFQQQGKDEKSKAYLMGHIGGGHSRQSLLRFAALVHDIGKPKTAKQDNGRMTFHRHEHVGRAITRLLAKHLKVTVKERYWLEDAVLWHLRPGYLSNVQNPSIKSIFRYMRDTKGEGAAIAMLAMCDQRATQGPLTTKDKALHHEQTCLRLIREFFKEMDKPKPIRLLNGHELMAQLKLKPSAEIGRILTLLEEAQAVGKVSTKKEALEMARALVQS